MPKIVERPKCNKCGKEGIIYIKNELYCFECFKKIKSIFEDQIIQEAGNILQKRKQNVKKMS